MGYRNKIAQTSQSRAACKICAILDKNINGF